MNTAFVVARSPSLRVGDLVRIDYDADHDQAGSEGVLKMLLLDDTCDAVVDLGDEFLVEVDKKLLTKIGRNRP